MLKIAICDDDQAYARILQRQMEEYRIQRKMDDISTETFFCPFDLIDAVEKGKYYDVFLLDINMPGMSGIALAKELRQIGTEALIIFVTASPDYALEAFSVGAIQYLLKPVSRKTFFSAMDTATAKSGSEPRRQIMLKTESGYRSIPLCNILFSEAHDKYQVITLTDKSAFRVRITCAKLYEMLSRHSGFTRCGVSYILNLAHIHSLNTKFVLLKNGVSIKIPRGAYPELKRAYFEFFEETQRV